MHKNYQIAMRPTWLTFRLTQATLSRPRFSRKI